jgi:hypothetical protein
VRFAVTILVAAGVLFHAAAEPRAQAIPAVDSRVTYILPLWLDFLDGDVATQVAELRSRIGDGPHVRVGFTTYVSVSMNPVDPSDIASIDAALQPTFDAMDKAIALGVANNIPICLSFVTAVRGGVDPVQTEAQNEDRRNIQWYSDNSMATGWTTFSRYARKQEAIQQAYIRELGRHIAARMAAHPDILVAASGDGEIELASPGSTILADYSPFAVAEFRDWLRGAGLYAPGQPFAGQAYANSARYASDSSIATLDTDFGLTGPAAFGTWNLKYFDWSLADSTSPDPNAIPASEYNAAGFDPMGPGAISNANGFDAPRVHQRGNAWSDLWDQFRESMVYRHNLEFAQWITTSADPNTGDTVPPDRWFTDQIPADYLFDGTPANPNGRFDTSASGIATANVSPYGSLGITSFNSDVVQAGPDDPESDFVRTLVGAAPAISALHVRWGVFEWNPALPPTTDPTIYNDEMTLVKQFHPSVLAPFLWDPPDSLAQYSIENTGFVTALSALAHDLNNVSLTLSKTSIDVGATSTGSAISPAQTILVSGLSGDTVAWSIASASPELNVVKSTDGRSFTVALKPGSYTAGLFADSVVLSTTTPGYSGATLTVTEHISLPGTTRPPQGAVDTPADGASVAGEVPITGWAVDDIGLASLSVCRAPVLGETTPAAPAQCGGLNNIFIGSGTFVSGARPDVLAQFPGTPLNDQAGWGYMLLSNMLPGGGNETYSISVVASDVDGHSVEIGRRTIIGVNAMSMLPFGTIDTPTQGQTVSGTIVNFGWALGQADVAADSSTITVLIDGVPVGHPGLRSARPDITAAFPTFVTDHAVGGYVLDTTTLTNGVHTIAWIVTDSVGHTQGVGSRFFTVAN